MEVNNVESRPPPELQVENQKPVEEVIEEVKEKPAAVKENHNIDVFA